MTDSLDRADRELRERFARERQRDRAWTPSFERVVARRPGRRRGVSAWLVLATAGLVAVGIVVVARTRRPAPVSEDAMRLVAIRLGEWRTPTDFLLDVSGAEFLREVPRIGTMKGWFPLTNSGSRMP